MSSDGSLGVVRALIESLQNQFAALQAQNLTYASEQQKWREALSIQMATTVARLNELETRLREATSSRRWTVERLMAGAALAVAAAGVWRPWET